MDIPAVAIAQLAKPDDEGLATLVVLVDHLTPPLRHHAFPSEAMRDLLFNRHAMTRRAPSFGTK